MASESSADEREGIAIPCYVFECIGREHEGERIFERFIHAVPKLIITQTECVCGAVAKRRIDKEIPTQALIGQTQISHATTVKGSVANDIKFAFGETKTNEDGSIDPNHRPFTTTGELDKFLNGNNNLGFRKVDDNGEPLKDSQGNYVKGGMKLTKFGPNDMPSQNDVRKGRRVNKDAAHVSIKSANAFPDTKSRGLRG